MRTQVEKHLEKLLEQIDGNQSRMAEVRREVTPEYWGTMSYKQRLRLVPGTKAYLYREQKLLALKRMEEITNRLVERFYTINSRYNQ